MRILIVTSRRAIVGGVETYLRELLPALAERGYALALLYEHDAQLGQPTIDDGIAEMPRWRVDDAAYAEASAWQPDLCFVNGLDSPQAEEELLRRFPCVMFAHNYHGTCVSGAKCCAFPRAQPCERVFGAACLGWYLPRRCGGLNALTMMRQYRIERRRLDLLPRYRAILVASQHMRAEYARHGAAPERLHVVPLFPPGVTPDREWAANSPSQGRVLLAGRLAKLKGGRYLVAALAEASRMLKRTLTLVVAGDGPERTRLERMAQRLNVPAEFHGWVDRPAMVRLMRSADLLAVPSIWPEPFGLVGLEAACVGLPAAGFAVGGITDWLQPGETGELAPGNPPTVAGLADAIVRALADPERLEQLRKGAWRRAALFTQDRHVALLESVWRDAVPHSEFCCAGESGPSRRSVFATGSP